MSGSISQFSKDMTTTEGQFLAYTELIGGPAFLDQVYRSQEQLYFFQYEKNRTKSQNEYEIGNKY